MLATAHAGAEQSLYQMIDDRPEVVAAWDLAGRTGLLLRVICKDMASFEALVEAFQQVPPLASFTCVVSTMATLSPLSLGVRQLSL